MARPENHASPKPFAASGRIAAFLRRHAVFRGFVGTIALLALAEPLLNLEQYEAARMLLAVIAGWAVIADEIGELLGAIPFVPELSADTVNTIVFFTSVTVPGIFGFADFLSASNKALGYNQTWTARLGFWIPMLIMSYLFLFGVVVFKGGSFEFLSWRPPGYPESIPNYVPQAGYLSIYVATIVMPFFVAVVLLSSYRRGVLLVVGSIAALQLLAFAPVLGRHVTGAATWLIEIKPSTDSAPRVEAAPGRYVRE